MTPRFSESQKVVILPLFPTPFPLLISDKSLNTKKKNGLQIMSLAAYASETKYCQ